MVSSKKETTAMSSSIATSIQHHVQSINALVAKLKHEAILVQVISAEVEHKK